MLNREQDVFAIISCCFSSAALSEFVSLPRVEISGKVPLILTSTFAGMLCEADIVFLARDILSNVCH